MENDYTPQAFIARWSGVSASELSTAQSFVMDLCALLGVDKPHPTLEQDYMFERPVTFWHADGSGSAGRIDCYKRGCFVLESKKLKAVGKRFDDGLLRAHAQAQNYARALPGVEGRPPFLLVVDVGTVIEVFAEFSQSGGAYTPFPDPRSYRIALRDLAKPEVLERLRLIWTAPLTLNPAHISAKVTRHVAELLAQLAKSIEVIEAVPPASRARTAPETVASFLSRCLFSMFAEDIGLLPKDAFLGLLKAHRDDSRTLQLMLRSLWADMDAGGFSIALAKNVLHFNGKLFKGSATDGYSLLLTPDQIDLLIAAAQANWREVEPAIFGTLLERALNPAERHALGAHYTPRAYVERLVLPTVIEPLRMEWANAQAAALVLAHEGKLPQARAEVKKFHHRLCTTRVLDPACGSGNFLYVTLEHLKRLEGEVLNQLSALGQTQDQLGFEGETVTLEQLRGIEVNPRAAALAELVLWIGWLQWHIRTQGGAAVAEPVVHDYGNIEHRDAVLTWDAQEPAYDDAGQLRTRWDGVTFKTHPVTGQSVPDEAAQVVQWSYRNARQAQWPQADFIVGNPPFIGNKRMREALGDGYAQALRTAWPHVPDSADFVMYWWAHAAQQVASGSAQRMGLITTNSLTMIFNRRVVQAALDAKPAVELVFAIPDHPWVDSANGAAVRIAMTVAKLANSEAGNLQTVTSEVTGEHGEVAVTLAEKTGVIHADLTIGTNVAEALPLRAMAGISGNGVMLAGSGFIVTPAEAQVLGQPSMIRPYRNGRDLTDVPRGVMVIDAFGLTAEQLRQQFPAVYQWLHDRVKPERDQNNRPKFRDQWWIFGEPRRILRGALAGLHRYIATVETAKHRTFQFLDASILPDHMLIAIASADAFPLGVLSSRLHVEWALAQGGTLEDRPRYNKSRCFETFPFPGEDTGLTPALRQKITDMAEQIDRHRKTQQVAHTDVTLTGMYNVLAALREGRALTAKEKAIHEHGLVGVLKELHDELDAAVLCAYGLSANASSDDILTHLVALNAQRAAEEEKGSIRWLRPEFQNPLSKKELFPHVQQALDADLASEKIPQKVEQMPWPSALPEQVKAVARVLESAAAPLHISDIEARFTGKGGWKKSLPVILETLQALGRARCEVQGWRG